MKNRIKHILLYQLRNEEHFNFHSEFVKLVNEIDLSQDFLALRAIYDERYDELDATLEFIRASAFTKQLVAADWQRIYTYRRLRAAVRGFLRHADPPKRLAAERAIVVIRHYGNLPQTSRDERTATLAHLLEDLRGEVPADLQALGLATWVSELEASNLAYQKLKESRSEERKTRSPARNVDEARVAADASYQAIIHYLESYGVVNPAEENYVGLVFSLNDAISGYSRLLAQRQGIMAAQREKAAQAEASSSSSGAATGG